MSDSDKSGKKSLGEFVIRRAGERVVELTIPEGMRIEGDDPLTFEDIKDAIELSDPLI